MLKRCRGCGLDKPLADFHRRKDAPNARHRARCKACTYVDNQKNPKLKLLQEAWRARNRERVHAQQRARRRADPQKNAASFERWRANNLAHCAEKTRRRDAAKLRATPVWADRRKIVQVYEAARALTERTGVVHEVDHIYPLKSDIVCGLHVHQNLQILTKSENAAKKNRVPTCL